MSLNRNAILAVESLLAHAEEYRVAVHAIEGGGRFVDCGIEARGGMLDGHRAGADLSGRAGAGLDCAGRAGRAAHSAGSGRDRPPCSRVPGEPVRRLGTQGGKVLCDGFGPDAGGGRERGDFRRDRLPRDRRASSACSKRGKPPPPAIVGQDRQACRVDSAAVTLLAAPTASLAGGLQIVARSVETALHKLAELKFDLARIVSAHGTAPLPPVAANDLAAIGRTNDAILYGARVILAVTGDDASLETIGPRVPSSSSRDHGEPFAAIFARYNHDFYAVDPHLFSPAEITFQNIETGHGPYLRASDAGHPGAVVRDLRALENRQVSPDDFRALNTKLDRAHDDVLCFGIGFGWHVEDLHRAAERSGVTVRTALFPSVSASVGMKPGARLPKTIGQPEEIADRASEPARSTCSPPTACWCG